MGNEKDEKSNKNNIINNSLAVLHLYYCNQFESRSDFSGYIINEEGYAITAAHCIKEFLSKPREGVDKNIFGFSWKNPNIYKGSISHGSNIDDRIIFYFKYLSADFNYDIALLKPTYISLEDKSKIPFVEFDIEPIQVGDNITSLFWNTEYEIKKNQ